MKKVLVTGAAGMIGLNIISYLLSEGKYEITALDLKNRDVIQKLKKYRKRINIVLGDVTDRILVEALVKDHDIIIHLAGVLPPLADIKKDLAHLIDFKGCENFVRAISYYNPKCHLFYASTTNLYQNKDKPNVKSAVQIDEFSYYNQAKYDAEVLIKSKIKHYTIYRLPFIIGHPLKEPFPIYGNKNCDVDVITKEDAAYAFVKGIDYKDELNRKVFNVSGEVIPYRQLLNNYLEICGLSYNYILTRLFVEKIYYSSECSDKEQLNDLIKYRDFTYTEYLTKLRRSIRKRKFQKIIAKPFIRSDKK